MFEMDYPHPTCLYPDPLKTAEETMRELSTTAQRRSSATTEASTSGGVPASRAGLR